MNSSLTSIAIGNNWKGNYIYGELTITETVNGKTINSLILPELTLKLEDGTTKQVYVLSKGGNKYYFDVFIDGLTTGKNATIQVQILNKTQNIKTTSSDFLGFTTSNQAISYSSNNGELLIKLGGNYEGSIFTNLTNIAIGNNHKGNYIYGELTITETVSGKTYSPTALPILTLVLEDGTSKQVYVLSKGGNKYYFDVFIDGLTTGKTATIEAELSNSNNVSSNKAQNIKTTSSGTLGNTTSNHPISYSSNFGELVLILGYGINDGV